MIGGHVFSTYDTYDEKIRITTGKSFRSIDPFTTEPLLDVHKLLKPTPIQPSSTPGKPFLPGPPRLRARSRISAKAIQLLRERNDEIAQI